jgi:hypothetical protein
MSDSPRSSKVPPMLAMVLLFSTLVGGARPAWGWGDLGHKIVCQIAFQELNNKARAEVVRLIALDETFDSFTDACTWPDYGTGTRPAIASDERVEVGLTRCVTSSGEGRKS